MGPPLVGVGQGVGPLHSALCAGGLQTVIGMTSNGGSTALPEESLAFAAEPEQGCELGALGTSDEGGITYPSTWTWAEGEEEDVPNFGEFTSGRAVLHRRVQSFLLHTPGLPG